MSYRGQTMRILATLTIACLTAASLVVLSAACAPSTQDDPRGEGTGQPDGRCQATTRQGSRCRRAARPGKTTCAQHAG